MSIKSPLFTAAIGGLPANSYAYIVLIPTAMGIATLAKTVSWHSQKRPEIGVIVAGKNFYLPAYTENSSGIITVGFYDNSGHMVREKLRELLFLTDFPTSLALQDIDIIKLSSFGTPVAITRYSHCWLSQRSTAELAYNSVTDAVAWNADFYYNGIHEHPILPNTPAAAMLALDIAAIQTSKALIF